MGRVILNQTKYLSFLLFTVEINFTSVLASETFENLAILAGPTFRTKYVKGNRKPRVIKYFLYTLSVILFNHYLKLSVNHL